MIEEEKNYTQNTYIIIDGMQQHFNDTIGVDETQCGNQFQQQFRRAAQ